MRWSREGHAAAQLSSRTASRLAAGDRPHARARRLRHQPRRGQYPRAGRRCSRATWRSSRKCRRVMGPGDDQALRAALASTPPCASAARRSSGPSPKPRRASRASCAFARSGRSRFSSWAAARICSCAMAASAAWSCISARGEFKKVEVRDGQDHGRRGREAEGAGLSPRAMPQIGGFEWFEGIPGNVGGAPAHECRRDGRRDVSPGRERALRRSAAAISTCRRRRRWRCITATCRHAGRRTTPSPPPSSAIPSTPEEIEKLLEQSMQKRRTTPAARIQRRLHLQESRANAPRASWWTNSASKAPASAARRVSEIHGNFIVNDRRRHARRDVLAADRGNPAKRAPGASAASSSRPKCRSSAKRKGIHDP